jgi:ubiquinone/menaquinone biosynthesis C-methylase UbiE
MAAKKDFRKRVKSYYNTFAGWYDLSEFFRHNTRRAVVQASGCREGEWALEICSGTCELALAFAHEHIQTVAVDLVESMLRVGMRKRENTYLDFLETDALQLPFTGRSFDVVAVSLALHHMPEETQIRVMKEMSRLSRRRVITMEWHTPENPALQRIKGWLVQLMDISEYIQPWMGQDFRETCRKAELEIIEERVLTGGFHRLSVCVPLR